MEEVLTRRLTAYLAERDRPPLERGDKPRPFAYPPQLLVVDGGKGQLGVAERVVRELGLEDEIPVAGLAKRFEEVFVPGRSEPVEIPRGSEALFMLQRIRDEAHRFANTFHGERRSKRMTTSALDGIAGLGETRRKRLLKELGGVNAVKAADLDDVARPAVAARRRRRRRPRQVPRPRRDRRGARRADAGDAGRPVGAPRRVVDRRVHRGRRPGVRRADPAAGGRGAGRRPARARRRVRRRSDHPPRRRPRRRRVGRRRRPDVEPDPRRRRARRRDRLRPRRRRRAAVRRRLVRRRRRLPRVRAHRRRRRGDRRDRPRARAGRPVLLLPQPPAAADAGQRLDRRPDPRPARAVLADRAVPRRRR